ncbi:HPP family protein [Luteolibacter marinus]|uniref:HPP family protein n=1 Tax=Luteolibacter marinus TaxID=2776705 RepID=UPI0018667EEC|nr:HPP family protein [Luteolibacter marinus]
MRRISDLLGIELNVVSAKERLVAVSGGAVAILLLCLIIDACVGLGRAPALVASMGASAVLLFAVPHGQLSQPWPVVGGHVLSALVGVTCARWIPHPALASAAAVGLSIGAMHQLKCIHPPGGATALTAVLGGSAIYELGFGYVLCPVLANAVVMVGVAIVFNAGFKWRRYPAALNRRLPTDDRSEPGHEDVIAALKAMDLFIDVDEGDLLRLSEAIRSRVQQEMVDRNLSSRVAASRERAA